MKATEVASQENEKAATFRTLREKRGGRRRGEGEACRWRWVSAGSFSRTQRQGCMLSDGEMLQELRVRGIAKESQKQAKEEHVKARESKRKSAFKGMLAKTEKKGKTPAEWEQGRARHSLHVHAARS